MTDWGIGDAGHPRFFCRKCGLLEYVQPFGRGVPPDRHQRIFDKMHRRANCDGEREYRAGVAPGLRRLVEESERRP